MVVKNFKSLIASISTTETLKGRKNCPINEIHEKIKKQKLSRSEVRQNCDAHSATELEVLVRGNCCSKYLDNLAYQ